MAIRMRPLRRLEAIGFPAAAYPTLNGKHQLAPPRLAIERCLLMVGYPSATAALAHVGPWRAEMLINIVRGFLTDPGLSTTAYFQNLDPSERRVMSFLLAQAFTCWFAQQHLGAYVLVHVRGAAAAWTPTAPTAPVKAGAGAPKANSEPDFIGIGPNEFHVFESKGRSISPASSAKPRNLYTSCRKGALAQACRIDKVMGVTPVTRNAAVWVLMGDAPRGYVEDPPTGVEPLDLKFDLGTALRQAYRAFLQSEAPPSRDLGDDFVGFELGDDRSLGIDQGLLKLLQGDGSAEEILAYLQRCAKRFVALSRADRDVGPEGVMVAVPKTVIDRASG
jgi:hypothetical protein